MLFKDYEKEQPNHSPVRSQYLQIKQQNPDAILFFRMGDFYEMFDDDADIVAAGLREDEVEGAVFAVIAPGGKGHPGRRRYRRNGSGQWPRSAFPHEPGQVGQLSLIDPGPQQRPGARR